MDEQSAWKCQAGGSICLADGLRLDVLSDRPSGKARRAANTKSATDRRPDLCHCAPFESHKGENSKFQAVMAAQTQGGPAAKQGLPAQICRCLSGVCVGKATRHHAARFPV